MTLPTQGEAAMNPEPAVLLDMVGLLVEIDDVATRFVNQAAPGLPPLRWHVVRAGSGMHLELLGNIDEFEHSDPESVAQQWASVSVPPSSTGTAPEISPATTVT